MSSIKDFEKLLFEGIDDEIDALQREKLQQNALLVDDDLESPANRIFDPTFDQTSEDLSSAGFTKNKPELEEVLLKSLGLLAIFRKEGVQNIPLIGIFAFIYIAYECSKSKTGKVKADNLRVVLGIDLPTAASLLSRMGDLPTKYIKANKIKLPVYLKHDKCDVPLLNFDNNYENYLYVGLSAKGAELTQELGELSVFQFK